MNYVIKMALLSRIAKAEESMREWEQADNTYWAAYRAGVDVETGAGLERENRRAFNAFVAAVDAFEALAAKHGMELSIMERLNFNPVSMRKRVNLEM
jgi:hypothetical protein